jgi:prepilin-type N-terminal cleavage/methylation domain-containing protein
MNKRSQSGFTLVEIVVGMIVLAIVAGGLISSLSYLYKGSSGELQMATQESVARSAFDREFTGTYPPANSTYPVGNDTVTVATSTNTSTTCAAGCTHIKVTVGCAGCAPISLSGDDYNAI